MGTSELVQLGVAALLGVGAALFPMFVNSEVYVVALAATIDTRGWLMVLIMVHVLFTTAGKAFVFVLARQGTRRIQMVDSTESQVPTAGWRLAWHRFRTWYSATRFAAWVRRGSAKLLTLLDHRYLGGVTVLVSSLTGIPPLAIVTILAGASKQPMGLFLVMCFIGRCGQFFAIAFLLHGVLL